MRWWLASESPVRYDDRRRPGVAAGEDTGRQNGQRNDAELQRDQRPTEPERIRNAGWCEGKDFLELSTVAGKFEQAGLMLKMVAKSKEKVEVNTFI
jgi:hypothetical protein